MGADQAQDFTCTMVKNLEHIHGQTCLPLRGINPLMMLDRVICCCSFFSGLLGNGSSSSSRKHQCQSGRDQELWVSSQVLRAGGSPGHPEQLGPGGSRCSPSKWKVCLFLGYRLSGRKDGHCQGFYWIPVKGIERVSCLLSFPAPAVVKEVFYL